MARQHIPVVLHDALPELLGLSQEGWRKGVDDILFRGQQDLFSDIRREGGKDGGQVHFWACPGSCTCPCCCSSLQEITIKVVKTLQTFQLIVLAPIRYLLGVPKP